MIIKNCKIIFLDKIENGSVLIRNGKIEKINPEENNDEEVIDAQGSYLSPGFIDVHIHGAGGFDTMDGTVEAINAISKIIAGYGTTSFLPTTMTCALDDIKKSVEAAAICMREGTDGANVLGVHLEGPYISPNMIGAQNPNYVETPAIDTFKYIVGHNISAIKSITLAPEVEGAKELIQYVTGLGIVASMGHTKASYKEAIDGIKWGIGHSTHLYNAMTPLNHREPGVVGAIFDTDITTETISDGIHISYPSLRIAYKQKGFDKVLLVTDAMMACGMPEGKYSLGGQDVFVKDGAARLKEGNLAGSILTLDKAIRNIYKNNSYALYDIVKMATYNGAKHCGVSDKKGLIKEGYDADLVLFDEDINIQKVIISGKFSKV
ncbi:N-acetylglucosamine-6-phosphate deacetylase [Clostridium swellfunianum]|uniref:N-acetylglucosamine-6-phosphate deacetylase n=1 Tax=Clostridium swellfunianum TaxID=1367462 RepID=UPI00202FB7E1|nr:N-acetylglucosamine-6-phosphate deacetylase [Clostridium swellfunianum]MCM0649800.1 N-acetylglucosamine-6-phosphate deacetylase [Clostridium swellfunianum]